MKKDKRKKIHQRGLEVLPGEGKRFAGLKHVLVFYLLLTLAAALILQFGYHWLGGQFLAWRLKIVSVEREYLWREYSADGLILREETVIEAPGSGLIIRLASGDQRVASGSEILILGVIPESEFRMPLAESENGDQESPEASEAAGENIESEDSPEVEEATDFSYYGNLFENMLHHGQEMLEPDQVDGRKSALVRLTAPAAGYLSYHTDGLENYYGSPFLTRAGFEELAWQSQTIIEGDPVSKGQPLFKIVNNWFFEYSFIVPLEPGREFADMNQIQVIFPFAAEQTLSGQVIYAEIDPQNQAVRITLRFNEQVEGFDTERFSEALLQYDRLQGIIVPAEAIFEMNGQSGVYVNQGGRVLFRAVDILEIRDGQALVGELPEYSLVISHPELVEEGQRLN